jgi:hypothetical protein
VSNEEDELVWQAELDSSHQHSWIGRQDQLVSSGKALVVLYPSHADMFRDIPHQPDAKALKVRTEIRRVD